jgi:curli biogenesis system outer membrane secretion channel CsgG
MSYRHSESPRIVRVLDTMRRARLSVIFWMTSLAALTMASHSTTPQQTVDSYSGPKLRIAVMDLSGTALRLQTSYQQSSTTSTVSLPPPAEFARGLTEMLTTALVQTGRFVVVERAQIEKVTGEQDFGASGHVNPETAAAKGKIIGAQSLITGDITEFTYQQSSLGGAAAPLKIFKVKSDKVTAMVAIDIRLIDAVTGEVLFSQRCKGSASATGVGAELTRGDQGFSAAGTHNTPLGHASREAIEQAVAAIVGGMKKQPWSGRIIDLREGQIYINAGLEAGIQQGMEFDVYEQQEALVDPDTGKALGTPDRKLGSLKVDTVQDKYAIASATSGTGFKRGHLVRLKGQGQKP